ncbi:lectin-like domain-containing protein [Paraflavitalea speifideaquila]|uniref:lectin-like domain-containing protein n=1 Tax=Paraflavitalea speifideaquila TaxID=3076558 RepID=UPI0028EAE916|nr:PKD domain-containing protein [Paraflavitalea speifideiaquila]
MRPCLLYMLLLLLASVSLPAQTNDNYFPNGSAFRENCNCYTLTNEQSTQSGSVWNKIKIDLTQSFDYKFNINLGNRDADGADGMVFVLQNISLSIGSTGEGMGFGGVTPSIGIPIDTWQNGNQNDPAFDHISINRDGDVNHTSSNNLAGPVTALAGKDNIEDGQWHTLRISWNAVTKSISAQIDGVERVQATIDLVAQVFNNNPIVYWGFTAGTGGSYNRQRFCTSLNPGFSLAPNQLTCFPASIQFHDNSLSFGTILNWYWDFGDGTKADVQTPPPHVYPSPGIYQVKLNIFGNDGCLSDTFKTTVVVGSKPVANFGPPLPPYCNEAVVPFTDSSKVQFGSINTWEWQIDGQPVVKTSPGYEQAFTYGPHTMSLLVKTKEGCVSDPITRTLTMSPAPVVDMRFSDTCFRTPVLFTSSNLTPTIPVKQWYWLPGDGSRDSSISIEHVYTKGGQYTVKLYAVAENGCYADTVEKPIRIYETHAFAGNDTVVTDNHPLPLHGSGGELYNWSPPDGLSDPDIANPIAFIKSSMSYVLTAYTPMGCETKDTIRIKVFKGPAIYVPNVFSPNGDQRNDRFRMTAVGISDIYFFRIFNRYGQLVYNSNNSKEGWDGTIKGQPQATGTYVWMVKGKDFTGQLHEQKGTFMLVR